MRPSQLSAGPLPGACAKMRVIAPMIRSRRISVWPAFRNRPRRSFPQECCRGTRPSQAAKCGRIGTDPSEGQRLRLPTPSADQHPAWSGLRAVSVSSWRLEPLGLRRDLFGRLRNLRQQLQHSVTMRERKVAVSALDQRVHPLQMGEGRSETHGPYSLEVLTAARSPRLSPLADQPFAVAEQDRLGLLLGLR